MEKLTIGKKKFDVLYHSAISTRLTFVVVNAPDIAEAIDGTFTFDNGDVFEGYTDVLNVCEEEITLDGKEMNATTIDVQYDVMKKIAELQAQIDALMPWTTYATGSNGSGSVTNAECSKSGRIVTITQTETPPSDADKRFVMTGYTADGYNSQYSGDVTIPMTTATLCQGIRPGFWDGDIFIEVGGVGAQMIYGAEGDGKSTYSVTFDTIAVQYKGE